MKNKYEELPMIDETMAEPETVNNETKNITVNNNDSSGVIKESTTSTPKPSTTEETEEIVSVESVPVPDSLGDTLGTNVGADEDKMDEEDDQQGDEDEDLKSKYVKLIEHNSRLVDLLKTTMQIQTDMFRKLIHYVFP